MQYVAYFTIEASTESKQSRVPLANDPSITADKNLSPCNYMENTP